MTDSRSDSIDSTSALHSPSQLENGNSSNSETFVDSSGKKVTRTSTGKRKFHNKSKSGCDNCKRRRVKCDENKPNCKKCKNMKLDCVYSPIQPRRKKTSKNIDDYSNTEAANNETTTATDISNNNSSDFSPKKNSTKRKPTIDRMKISKMTKVKIRATPKLNEQNIILDNNNLKQASASLNQPLESIPLQQQNSNNISVHSIQHFQLQQQQQQKQMLLLPQFMTLSASGSYPGSISGTTSTSIAFSNSQDKPFAQYYESQNMTSPLPLQATSMNITNSFSSIFSPGRITNPLGPQSLAPNVGGNNNSFALHNDPINSINKTKNAMSVGMNRGLSGSMNMSIGVNMGIFSPTGIGGVNYDFQELLGLKFQPNNTQSSKASIAEQELANMQQHHLEQAKNRTDDNKTKMEDDNIKVPDSRGQFQPRNFASTTNSNDIYQQLPISSSIDVPPTPITKATTGNNSAAYMSHTFSADTAPPELMRVNTNLTASNLSHTLSNQTAPPGYSNQGFSLGGNSASQNIRGSQPSLIGESNVQVFTNSFENNKNLSSESYSASKVSKWAYLSQQCNLNLIHLKLFHHYCTEVWPTIIAAGISGPEVWSVDIPALSFEYPFLMHSLLAFSATHLYRTEPSLESYVSRHRIDALRLLREAVLHISEENTDALVASAIILIMDSLANASNSSSDNSSNVSPSAWIFHVKGAATILTAVWPLTERSRFYYLLSMDLSGLGNVIQPDSDTISELVCFDESIADLYPVEIDSPYLITLAYLDKLYRNKDQANFILKIFAFPALLDKTFLALLMTGDIGAMRIMRSYYKLLRGFTTEVMDKVWFLEGVSHVLPQDVNEYSGGGGMHMMLDFLGGGLPSMTTTNMSEFIQ